MDGVSERLLFYMRLEGGEQRSVCWILGHVASCSLDKISYCKWWKLRPIRIPWGINGKKEVEILSVYVFLKP